MLLDWLVLLVLGGSALEPFGGLLHTSTSTSTTTVHGTTVQVYALSAHAGRLVVSVLVVLTVAYGTVLCGSRRGQTLGMMAVGVRVADVGTGRSLGYPRALARTLCEYVFFLVFFLPWVLDVLWPTWDRRNQTLHDKITRAVVVRC